jgi:ClpP class serine protease
MRTAPRALTDPWLISESGMQLVLGVWSRGELHPDIVAKAMARATAAAPGEPLQYSRETTVDRGIAVICIDGPLFRKAGLLTEVSGATSYEQIRNDLKLALADSAVRAIMLNVNSPGGEANGCSELADEIYAARSQKRIEAYIGGAGQSAACWLYSAAERATCSDTALLGCIGVRQSIIDTSKSDESAGIKVNDMVSRRARAKRDYPVDDEVLAKVQTQIDHLEEAFISAVARNRGVSDDDVATKFGGGDSLVGHYAVEAGLADDIGSLDSAITALVASLDAAPTTPQGASTMANPTASAKAADEPEKKDEDKKESKAADGMKKCADCDGSGEKDGKDCKSCDGEGEMPMSKKAADDKDEDEKPKSDADDGDEKKALAALAGVSASASLGSIRAALEAKTVPLTAQAKLQMQVNDLQNKLEAREKADRTAAAKVYADKAVEEGRTTKEKRARVEAEHAEKGEDAAEALLFDKGTFTLLHRFSNGKGDIIGKKDESQNFAQASADEVEKAMLSKSKDIAARDKITVSDAMAKVKSENHELYAAYAALRR